MSREILIREDGFVVGYAKLQANKPGRVRGLIEDDGTVHVPKSRGRVAEKIAACLGIPLKKIKVAGVEATPVFHGPQGDSRDEPVTDEDPLPEDEGSLAPDAIIDETSLDDMTKAELEEYARETYGVELDRRRTKDALIAQINALAKTKTAALEDKEN